MGKGIMNKNVRDITLLPFAFSLTSKASTHINGMQLIFIRTTVLAVKIVVVCRIKTCINSKVLFFCFTKKPSIWTATFQLSTTSLFQAIKSTV